MGNLLSRMNSSSTVQTDPDPIRNIPIIWVSGIPGAGNRTVCQKLALSTGYTIIYPGDLARRSNDTQVRRSKISLCSSFSQVNAKVPERAVVGMIKDEMLRQQNTSRGFIVCGFPRSKRSSCLFERQVRKPDMVLALKVIDEIAALRLEMCFGELGMPEIEILEAENIVRTALAKIKRVHDSIKDDSLITVDSSSTNLTRWNMAIDSATRRIKNSLEMSEVGLEMDYSENEDETKRCIDV